MEYLEGETLAARLRKGPLPLDQALRYAIEIADALDKAHRAGHRPPRSEARQHHADEGRARSCSTSAWRSVQPARTGAGLGTLPTTPPASDGAGHDPRHVPVHGARAARGQGADARTDIFAFGAVLYEMVTGKQAFEGKSQASLIARDPEARAAAVSALQPLTPRALDRVVRRCLAKDPDDRWQTRSDLMRELKWIAVHIEWPEQFWRCSAHEAGACLPGRLRRRGRRVSMATRVPTAREPPVAPHRTRRRKRSPSSTPPDEELHRDCGVTGWGGTWCSGQRARADRVSSGFGRSITPGRRPLAGHRRRDVSLLVARRPLYRLLRGCGKLKKRFSVTGGAPVVARRCGCEARRHLGIARRHPVRAGADRRSACASSR